jgi:hypothetical protein
MEALNGEIVVLLMAVLGFGSSLIHYSAFAKAKARAQIRQESLDL